MHLLRQGGGARGGMNVKGDWEWSGEGRSQDFGGDAWRVMREPHPTPSNRRKKVPETR